MVKHLAETEKNRITNKQAKNAFMKVLVSEKEGWDDYVMRVVEVDKDGFTPKHQHPWPHINYVIEGKGDIMIEGENHSVKAGSYAFVPNDALHQYRNTGDQVFKFICIVPKHGHH
ncbi:MAG TPA: cupin domain-containing protein [Candidatus Izemoplasmatales bacterium]|nr:cupin domain-containing protein [Candidatus Izemoplasmatales bacterium]